MSDTAVASTILLWSITIVNSLTLLFVVRALRASKRRAALASAGREVPNAARGLALGSVAPALPASATSRSVATTTWLLFVTVGCAPCHSALTALRTYVASRDFIDARFIVVIAAAGHDSDERPDLPSTVTVVSDLSGQLRRSFSVEQFPFAYVVRDGRIVAKGLVNDVTQVEAMMNVARAAFPINIPRSPVRN